MSSSSCWITLFPVIKVLVIGLIFKVTSAVLQPIADGPVVDLIDVMGKYILYILVALLLMSLMFFFAIVMLIIVSNMTADDPLRRCLQCHF